MIKNEIEYMHAKIDGIKSKDDLVDKLDSENEISNKYEQIFTTGQLGLSLLKDKN